MPSVKPAYETFARIKVIGVGGSGGNAVSHMASARVRGVELAAVNTDAQDLHHTPVATKVHIGKETTRGLGAGMNPELGRQSAEESREALRDLVKDADMVFITGGLGGGTCSGAAPILAKIAKDAGALTIAVVTKPFSFEGRQRARIASEALEELRRNVDAIVTIENDRILNVVDKDVSLLQAFKVVNEVLRQAVAGIAEIITVPGLINVDFADVAAIMRDAGTAHMGIGKASGEGKLVEAAKAAIASPLVETSIDGARGILFSVIGGSDITMQEVHEAAKLITARADPEAKIIFGAVIDRTMPKRSARVTVIATGIGPLPKTSPAEGVLAGPRALRSVGAVTSQGAPMQQAEVSMSEEEDPFEVPAFIRRKLSGSREGDEGGRAKKK
jgi:cell division protein FtsZ